jgi:hypothetical protein
MGLKIVTDQRGFREDRPPTRHSLRRNSLLTRATTSEGSERSLGDPRPRQLADIEIKLDVHYAER